MGASLQPITSPLLACCRRSCAATWCPAPLLGLTSPLLPQVMRYDLVPRFSPNYMEGLKDELMAIDYKALMTEDLMANPVSACASGVVRGCPPSARYDDESASRILWCPTLP